MRKKSDADLNAVLEVTLTSEAARAVTSDDRETRPRLATDGLSPDTVRELKGTVTARIVCVAGTDRGRGFPIARTKLVLGRAPGCEIEFTSGDVSRRHALLSPNGDDYTIEDLGSTGGTFVNGVRTSRIAKVSIGDRIQLGASTVLVLAFHDELEARMRRLEHLESVAGVVAGLAHDFRNALQVIGVNLDSLEESCASDANAQLAIEEVKRATASAIVLAKKLMNVGRREDPGDDTVVLRGVIDEVIAGARRMIPNEVAIQVSMASDICVRGSSEEYKSVFLNLVLNARDAMPDGGMLSIEARLVYLSASRAAALQLDRAGSYAEIEVTDTGIGMTDATLSRLFEPYFTTKRAGEGTGLGLAMVHGIVRRNRGAVTVESAVSRGTTFHLWLPARQSNERR